MNVGLNDMLAASTPSGVLLIAMIAVVIPLVVDLVTKRMASGKLKAIILLALSAVSGFLLEWLNSINLALTFNATAALLTTALTFVLGVGTFFGFTLPVGVSGADGVIAKTVQGGIGHTDPHKQATSDGAAAASE